MGKILSILDPVTRVEGHLRLRLRTSDSRVEQAMVQGTMYRGFENVLVGKHPDDARIICQRICGVCPSSHGIAAADAVERIAGATLLPNAHILRNLLLGSELLHSHILHFYHLCLPDYLQMPEGSPWGPSVTLDRRLSPETTDLLFRHYLEAFHQRKKAHTIGALVGGKMPHCSGLALGGMGTRLDSQAVDRLAGLLEELLDFAVSTMIPDAHTIAEAYPDYFLIGKGTGNFLCFGAFPDPATGRDLFPAGFRPDLPSTGSPVLPVLLNQVTESARYSWFRQEGERHPLEGETLPEREKAGAYSWIKAPRYHGRVCELGPYARLAMLGIVEANSSVMGRIMARVTETALLVKHMKRWLEQYQPTEPSLEAVDPPKSGFAVGRTEAPRGGLAHYVVVREGLIERYQIVTPTAWNCSPRDDGSEPGLLEGAAEGTRLRDEGDPIEVLRIVHSLDPCMACSVH